MSRLKSPAWTVTETATLREVYPSGGLKAALAVLPQRSWASIYMRANKLGLRVASPFTGGRRCKIKGVELDEALRLRADGWSFAKIGACLGYAESTVSNATLIHECRAQGYTPAERHESGRLTEAGKERLRWMLKKGLKGVDIQLRLGVSAAAVHNERIRYNADLKARGKALLPAPGNGEKYSGARIPNERRKLAEALFMQGFGTKKVSVRSGVSKTVCTRIRGRLVKKLKANGECLPGCDIDGRRRVMLEHGRHVPEELKAKFRELILQRVPVRRAARMAGIGGCTAYKLRDQWKAEGLAVPKPRLPGKTNAQQRELLDASAIPEGKMWRYRDLVRELGDADKARAALRAEIAAEKSALTFEDRLKLVADGRATIGPALNLRSADPSFTLGGISAGMI